MRYVELCGYDFRSLHFRFRGKVNVSMQCNRGHVVLYGIRYHNNTVSVVPLRSVHGGRHTHYMAGVVPLHGQCDAHHITHVVPLHRLCHPRHLSMQGKTRAITV